jgi:hypothetical protein
MSKLNQTVRAVFSGLLLAVVCALPLQAEPDSSIDGVKFQDGKACAMHGDRLEAIDDSVELPLHVKVNSDGTFKVGDGKQRQLEPGQVIRRDGWILNPDGSIQPVVDHVAMKAGQVMVVRDGRAETPAGPITLTNNLYITPDGFCDYPDGRHARLRDGQLFRLDGTSIPSKDTVTLKNGQVFVQKDGTLLSLTPIQIMGMNDGTRVHGDGLIQKLDGSTSQLQEGQTILIDGAITGH